jgi:hypothetical protein
MQQIKVEKEVIEKIPTTKRKNTQERENKKMVRKRNN